MDESHMFGAFVPAVPSARAWQALVGACLCVRCRYVFFLDVRTYSSIDGNSCFSRQEGRLPLLPPLLQHRLRVRTLPRQVGLDVQRDDSRPHNLVHIYAYRSTNNALRQNERNPSHTLNE